MCVRNEFCLRRQGAEEKGFFKRNRTKIRLILLFFVALSVSTCCLTVRSCFNEMGREFRPATEEERKKWEEEQRKQMEKHIKEQQEWKPPKEEPPKKEETAGEQKSEESFELPSEKGQEHKLEAGVVLITYGAMEYRKGVNQHALVGLKQKHTMEPAIVLKNSGPQAVKVWVTATSDAGDFKTTATPKELGRGQEYRLKLYSKESWTCYITVQAVPKK